MTRRPSIDDLYDLALPEQPVTGPDGSIAYVLRTTDREADRDLRALWLLRPGAPQPVQVTRGSADVAPAWSPTGDRIAFLRAVDGPPQVWVLPVTGGEPRQLTTLPLGAGAPAWSPDGASIAFSAVTDRAAATGEGPCTAATPPPVVTDRVDFKLDGAGLVGTRRRHVHVVDVATGTVRQVTRGDWHASDPAWSPDGTRLAFSAAVDDDSDLTLRSSAHVVDAVARDARPERVGSPQWQIGPVGWLPDGTGLLAVGRTDTRSGHAGLLRIGMDGSVTDLAAALDRNVMPGGAGYPGALPQPTADGRAVLFCARDRGYTHLYEVGLDSGAPRLLLGGTSTVSGVSLAGGVLAAVVGTPTAYGEVVTLDPASGAVTTRTSHSPADLERFAHEEREFMVSDGTVVHGWLLRDSARTGPAPLLVDIHGGPHNAWNAAADPVHLYHQELAHRGWTVLLVNPRGSDGYGEAFFTGAEGAWGLADAMDVLEPLDQLVDEGVADPRRLAVTGYSYGGYLTCYLTSRDDRFAAAVTGGVVCDLTAMVGTSDLGHFLGAAELGGLPFEKPAEYAAQSPISRVQDVRTPTLVVQGADDVRCPVGQAEQWFTALREQRVPTRLVLYPGASHLFVIEGAPSQRADWNHRVVDWVEQYAGTPGAPRRVPVDRAHWQQRLTELAGTHRVPGATLGILRLGEEPVLAHTGVLNTATGVEVTDDSVFQIGSISKVWTTTVVMQLVDEGRLDLDAPVVEVLPELRLSDPDVTEQVTMRHLLTHTSGIDGDVFTDTGRGDDCLERYVESLADVAMNHPLGVTFSYCNSGYSLVGRVIERLTGQTWDQAMRERLFVPLGLQRTGTLPEEALLFRAAVGHVGEGDDAPQPAPVWGLPRSLGPAGLITSTAAEVLEFARMHLGGGVARDGTRVLQQESVREMTTRQVDLPDPFVLGDSWGVGWIRFEWGGRDVVGHDGSTIGQAAFLRLLPSHGLAVVLLTNGGGAHGLYRDLFGEVCSELADLRMPEPLAPPVEPAVVDHTPHLGTYERAGARIEVVEEDGRLRIRQSATGPLAELLPEPTQVDDLVPVDEGLFAYRERDGHGWVPVVFYALASGEAYLHSGVRATPKVA